MWSFNRKTEHSEAIKKSFSKFMDERIVRLMLNNPEGLEMKKKKINFVMILVKEDSNTAETIGKAVNFAWKHDAMIDAITGTLISIYFGVPLDQPDQKQMRVAFVNEISESIGPSLSIIHGECECPVGNVGTENRMNYTALLTEYKSKLKKLTALDFGQIIED